MSQGLDPSMGPEGRPVAGVSVWLVEAHVLLVVFVSSSPCECLGAQTFSFFLTKKCIFIYLGAPVAVVACGIFSLGMRTLSCGI